MSNRDRNATRWLRADLGDVVQVVPRGARGGQLRRGGAGVGLSDGLRRWSRRLARQRSLAVMRRQLLLIGTLAAIAALVILIIGDERPWWLAAVVVAFAILSGAVALLRRPNLSDSAQAVDHALALHDRLGTALELQARGASGGLAGIVRSEADAEIRGTLSQARAALTPAGREWAWLAVVVVALAVLIAVPRGGTASLTGPGLPAVSPLGTHATVPGAAGGKSSTSGKFNGQSSVNAQQTASTPETPPGRGASADPYQYHGKQYKNNAPAAVPAGELTKPPKLNLTAAEHAGASGGSGGGGSGGGKSGSASHTNSSTGGKLSSGGGGGGGGKSGVQPAGAGGQGGSTPGSGQASSGQSGSQQGSGAAPPGGESAGSMKAPALGQSTGITSASGQDNSSLPLQGGFRPVGGKGTGTRGGQQTEQNGGGGASRTATVGASGGAGTGNFAALAPTFNSPSSNSSITSYYFGTANQLSFKGW